MKRNKNQFYPVKSSNAGIAGQLFDGVDTSVHFVGIGGIGVSALAQYYLASGLNVSGSDLYPSEVTHELATHGVHITTGPHKKSNVPPQTDRLIYTAAVPKDNAELCAARERGIPTQTYAEALGTLTKHYRTITVSGTHGKSTTTAMTALVMEEGYCDPTVIVGTKVPNFNNSNFRKGNSAYLLLEADEWNKSFLKYHPDIAVITNIDADHLDTYKNLKNIEDTFIKYCTRVPDDGVIIANADDAHIQKIAKRFGKRVHWYSLHDKEAETVRTALRVPGIHNISNALAAFRVGKIMGIPTAAIISGLHRFRGTWRRFELKGFLRGASVFTDYGHHPTEIKATIQATRAQFPFQRIWCMYQPHQYQRLAYLWDDFITAFDNADRVCLLPVYDVAGRETKEAKEKVNSAQLATALIARGKNVTYQPSFADAKEFLIRHVRTGDIVLIMGAGDIYNLNQQLFT